MYIIVAGAGIIGRQITQLLVASKHNVVVLDKDPEICEMVYTETGATTVQGNATDLRTLESAGANPAVPNINLSSLSPTKMLSDKKKKEIDEMLKDEEVFDYVASVISENCPYFDDCGERYLDNYTPTGLP